MVAPRRLGRKLPIRSWVGSHRAGSAEQPEIGTLVFHCPISRVDIDSGIALDRRTFRSVRSLAAHVWCSSCRQDHEFRVAFGHVAPLVRP